ncbi:N-acetylmuramoyl-L-alanine amidase [Neobacillus dielmonensis]|uniref:N-acetylmuramoyl-L-alanine amidase n=1 Tax=Neobacillus dielmonensis TaxID=1347369 RepID=UPI000694E153|nr:N-acetylmuramoyl-L-alanine amidase [Neobacillus dielmonensis]
MRVLKNFGVILLAGIVLVLFARVPSQASAQTTGALGNIDSPANGNTVKGKTTVNGWYLDDTGVSKVEVLVDGTVVGQAEYGDQRPDVQKAYPQYNNGNSGFHYTLDTTNFTDGVHTVTIRGTGLNGRNITIPGNTVTIANVKGYLDNPFPGATLIGTHTISGWALDDSGVAKIEILVDGIVAGEATYGDERPDVQKANPQYNNGKAGFHYPLDTTKYSDGLHTFTIKETGLNGRVTTLSNSSIIISNVKGYLDNPALGTNLTGTANISGWFLDKSGVTKIEILVDGAAAGDATYGDARLDVLNAYPLYKNGFSGYHYNLDTAKYSDGNHTITIRETGANGQVTTLSPITVSFSNTRGYLDQPISSDYLKGKTNVSGWFLDSSGVSKLDVLVDGIIVGQAIYGDERKDVKKAFPEFNNGNAGFHYSLDSTKFNNGPHTIAIQETSTNGRTTLLPEVKVNIRNEAIGYLDNPVHGSNVKGKTTVSGWFLDPSSVSKIEVMVDGHISGEATYGDERLDVKKAFPEYSNGNAGFHYTLDTSGITDGNHTLTIKETGTNGSINTLAVSINIANFKGYLDNPASSTKIKGTYSLSGWLLDEFEVEKIEVLVDGVLDGKAIYGDARRDVQKAFPEYGNGKAGFHYTLDTAKYSDGKHTITIRETGKTGRVNTIPATTVIFKQNQSTVFLDPGHGGWDSGAVGGGYREADLNLAVAKKVRALLEARGYTVYMSRSDNTFVELLDRSQMANDLAADIFVSIHHNSTGSVSTSASGIESYFYKYDPDYQSKINQDMHNNPERIAKSMSLANIIQSNMVEYTGAYNRGTDGQSFAVIREAAMPATLLELGFINNASERQKLATDSYQNKLAKAIADGIDEYFKVY